MIYDKFDFETSQNAPHTLDDARIQAFVKWLLETSGWKGSADTLMERCVRFRRELIETATPVPVPAPAAPAPAAPTVKHSQK